MLGLFVCYTGHIMIVCLFNWTFFFKVNLFWQFENLANKKARTLYLYWGKALWLWSKLKFSLRISVEFSKLENLRTNLSPQKTSLAPRTCENKDFEEIWQIKKAEPPSISSRTLPLKFFFQAVAAKPLARTTCLADKTNHPVKGLSLNRSQYGSCSTKYDTPAGT